MNWIKLEDEFPDFGKEVLCYRKENQEEIIQILRLRRILKTFSKDGANIETEWLDNYANPTYVDVQQWAEIEYPKKGYLRD